MIIKTNADTIGIFSGGLCLIHCIATPFLFLAKACTSTCCADAPVWWQLIDYLFIIISFAAIYFTTKNSTKRWVRNALWISWAVLLFVIINETFETHILPELFIYVPALSIIALHLYNQKYCKCAGNTCCTK